MQGATFTDTIFLLHLGRLPSPGERRLLDAILIGVADHGSGAPRAPPRGSRPRATGHRISSAIAAGILAIGDDHGGAGSNCMELIAAGLALAKREGVTPAAAAQRTVEAAVREKRRLPGLGHRVHTTDPRVKVLFDMARAEGVAGDGILFMEALEAEARARIKPLPMNIDGALAAVLHDMGFPPPAGRFLFIVGRVAGLTAEVAEEYAREKPMRIKFTVDYDGVSPEVGVTAHGSRTITAEETEVVHELVGRARAAMAAIARLRPGHGRPHLPRDRLGRRQRADRDAAREHERGRERHGHAASRRAARRCRASCATRSARRAWASSRRIRSRGLVKYAKPAGVIAALIPVTSPYVTPVGIAIYAIKCKDAVIFSPHPSSRNTTIETVRIMRAALKKLGVPEDVLQVVERPSIPLANELMAKCDLTIATGGPAMVKAAYGSGKPAYGVGAGNATMVIDETANVEEAARNTRISKTNDNGSGCSADGNLLVDSRIYDAFLAQLQKEGGYLVNDDEKAKLQAAYWDAEGRRTADTIARGADVIAKKAGIDLPDGQDVLHRPRAADRQGAPLLDREARRGARRSSSTTASTMALDMVRQIFETGGRGHSCGIYSFDDEHIHQLALVAPVSRIMVRQVQSSSNAGTFTNGMPMTSSMGCGVWGGNITNENISLKHYMNVTWVSRPIPEDRPSEQELFGEFYNSEVF